MDLDWDTEFAECNDNVDMQWRIFTSKLKAPVDLCIPVKEVRNKRHTIPVSRTDLTKIKRKQRLWTRLWNTRREDVYSEYCNVRNQVRRLTRQTTDTRQYEKGVVEEVKTNPKTFWSYVHTKTKTRMGVYDLYINGDTYITTSDRDKTEALVDFYTSVFTEEPYVIHIQP
jgi:hypothetical protein